jgi:arylsulfatase A-like enzyme
MVNKIFYRLILSVTLALWVNAALPGGYPVVDTGQLGSYDERGDMVAPERGEALYGQDGQYAGAQPSYRDNGDGTVSDLVTGLMWTQDPGEKMTLSEASENAKKCNTGGHSDWRLPTIKELYSLIQLNGIDPDPRSTDTSGLKPFIDTNFFNFQYGREERGERIIDSQYASSTQYVSTTMGGNETMFGVNFADGRIKGYPIKSRRGEGKYYVLYVRENPDYGINQFKDNGNDTITDEATGLTWMKADSGKGMDWPTALEYAEGLEFAGHSDWRLPNAKELQSIIGYTRSPDTTGSAAIDPIFDATEIKNEGGKKDFAHYWTSSTHIGARGSETAVYFAFGRSLGFMKDRRTGEYTLMDVHGAGSQRSDPKIGDASDFPHGRGPQGDVIRIENMVRCVRGGDVTEVESSPNIEVTVQQRHRRRDGGRTTASDGDGFIKRLDKNKDGQVSKSEYDGPAKRFTRLDKDGNGIITTIEAPTGPPPGRSRPASDRPSTNPTRKTADQSPVVLADSSEKPNFVFILTDDMGWTGTSVEMSDRLAESKSDFYKTPNIEKLANQGMRFSRAYSPAALCTPSRAAILTGKTPAELHMTTPGGGRTQSYQKLAGPMHVKDLPSSETTIAEALKKAGYATAHLGKWHLGHGEPGEHGFDLHDGSTGNNAPDDKNGPKDVFGITERAGEFMTEQAREGKPFYLQLSHYAVHMPVEALDASKEKFSRLPQGDRHSDIDYAAMTYDLDASIGTLLNKLEELKLTDNTYVVFMSDNGAGGNPRRPQTAPLKGGKGNFYEGGIRVPLIVRGPGIEANSSSNENVIGSDLFPTFSEWAGVSAIEEIEGSSLVPLLTGKPASFQRQEKSLLFHYPHYGQGPAQKPQSAVIVGNYKLLRDLETETVQLFDLEKDLSEKNDLAQTMPGKADELEKLLNKRLQEVDAQMPTTNQDYDPEADPSTKRRRRNE